MENIAINAFIIWGIHFCTDEGQIFGWIGDRVRGLPRWAYKPLTECPMCMASFWGLVYYAAYINANYAFLPAHLLAVCGLNYILKKLHYAKDIQEVEPEN